MAATTGLMTVEQFRQLPEAGEFYYELRHGEAVAVTRPKFKHTRVQVRLRELLEDATAGLVSATEFPFRALPEYELRTADVALISRDRYESIDPEDNLSGAPELVIEVLSRSNTVAEMNDKEKLCLENGSRQFWLVDPDLKTLKVSTPDGITTTYRAGQQIPLAAFNGTFIKVDEIFN